MYVCIYIYVCLCVCRFYQLGSPVVSLSISCATENCEKALNKDGVQITIVHNTQVATILCLNIVQATNICFIATDHVIPVIVVVDSLMMTTYTTIVITHTFR